MIWKFSVPPESNDFRGKSASESGKISISNTQSMDYQGRLMLSYNRMFGVGTLLSVIGGGTILARPRVIQIRM